MTKISRKRSIAKAITWESISTVVTMAIAYPFTGSIGSSAELAATCLGIKVFLFYYHECFWHSISWGNR